jgi:hypothetical protein|tara:strand:+ start:302 stop:583 length:282 start_codon:yes stop_codon:yes gene_type:complete
MVLSKYFTSHPASVGETYREHFYFATKVFCSLSKGALACICHAFFPAVFSRTASDTIRRLSVDLEVRTAEKPFSVESSVPLNKFQEVLIQGSE